MRIKAWVEISGAGLMHERYFDFDDSMSEEEMDGLVKNWAEGVYRYG